jgi:hypothetical protein
VPCLARVQAPSSATRAVAPAKAHLSVPLLEELPVDSMAMPVTKNNTVVTKIGFIS